MPTGKVVAVREQMKIGVISTFPEHGSRNIGDLLISKATEAALSATVPGCSLQRFYRGDPWERIAEAVSALDHIVFACLAVRERAMFDRLYPYAQQIQATGLPYTILSAGTELAVEQAALPSWAGSDTDRTQLLALLQGARGVATRGVLTQAFLRNLGANCAFLGDIAFFGPEHDGIPFQPGRPIRRILISDPHYWPDFYGALIALHHGLKHRFPEAVIQVVLHGKSGLQKQLASTGIDTIPLFQADVEALDVYGSADLHVGFRVHGHVSALKRRVYSYLLEQDGRGADYGAALQAGISVPCFLAGHGRRAKLRRLANRLRLRVGMDGHADSRMPSPVFRILAMIDADLASGFQRFAGLDRQIDGFNRQNLAFLSRCLTSGND
jgi:hypothetical protein